jgi:O-acetyl-ADP-ribose deacetylase (regulator of RNase III)
MITHTQGDLLRTSSEAVVNTVNCVGVMGRGIALQFRNTFPENFKAYEKACQRGEVQPGKMFVFETGGLTNPRTIINFPTKRHWRGKSRMEDIESGLEALVAVLKEKKIRSVAIPPLGCGLGGLSWGEVRLRIEAAMASLEDVEVFLYAPQGAPDVNALARNLEVPRMTPGRAALVQLLDRYLAGLLDPFVTLLELHKLMYFMQEAGEALRLRFAKASFGPYAENLAHVLKAIEGHMVSGYADGGDAPHKQLSLVPGALRDAQNFLEGNQETHKHLEKVIELVAGFESPQGLELLATVHWVMKYESPHSLPDLVEKTHGWNERKRMFSPRQIGVAARALVAGGWVHHFPEPSLEPARNGGAA